MIVQCDKCLTKYRIADDKVTGKGVKVRCAKCENVFTVKPQAPRKPSVPSPTPLDVPESTTPSVTGSAPSQPKAPKDSTGDDTASIHAASPGPSPTPLDFTPPQSPPEDKAPPTPLDFTPPPQDKAPPVSEMPSSAFEDPAFSDEPLGQIEDSFPHPDQLSITGTARDESGPDASAPGSSDGSTDWGNIALDSEEDQVAGGPDVDFAAPPVPEPSAGMAPDIFASTVQPPSPGTDLPPQHPETEATRVTTRQKSIQPAAKGGKGLTIFLVLVLLGAGGYFAYPRIAPLIGQVTGRIPAANTAVLTVKNSSFGSVKRSDGITLITVRGLVVNETGRKQGMIRVTGEFKGEGGDILARSSSFCGNTFSDDDLNLMPVGRIRSALQNELGQSLSNSAVAPGNSVPFLLILENPAVGKIKEVTFKVESGLGNSGE